MAYGPVVEWVCGHPVLVVIVGLVGLVLLLVTAEDEYRGAMDARAERGHGGRW
jgi:hypothetical protein